MDRKIESSFIYVSYSRPVKTIRYDRYILIDFQISLGRFFMGLVNEIGTADLRAVLGALLKLKILVTFFLCGWGRVNCE